MLDCTTTSETCMLELEIARLRALVVRPVSLGVVLGILPAEERLLRELLAMHPAAVSKADMFFTVTGRRYGGGNVLDVHVSRMRPKLAAHGLEIVTHRGSCVGSERGGYLSLPDATAHTLLRIVRAVPC